MEIEKGKMENTQENEQPLVEEAEIPKKNISFFIKFLISFVVATVATPIILGFVIYYMPILTGSGVSNDPIGTGYFMIFIIMFSPVAGLVLGLIFATYWQISDAFHNNSSYEKHDYGNSVKSRVRRTHRLIKQKRVKFR